MPFPCPACSAEIAASPARPALRCPSCGALLRSRPVDTSADAPVFEVFVVGRPSTRQTVEVPWDEAQRRRLRAWLAVASAVTIALALALYALARLLR